MYIVHQVKEEEYYYIKVLYLVYYIYEEKIFNIKLPAAVEHEWYFTTQKNTAEKKEEKKIKNR